MSSVASYWIAELCEPVTNYLIAELGDPVAQRRHWLLAGREVRDEPPWVSETCVVQPCGPPMSSILDEAARVPSGAWLRGDEWSLHVDPRIEGLRPRSRRARFVCPHIFARSLPNHATPRSPSPSFRSRSVGNCKRSSARKRRRRAAKRPAARARLARRPPRRLRLPRRPRRMRTRRRCVCAGARARSRLSLTPLFSWPSRRPTSGHQRRRRGIQTWCRSSLTCPNSRSPAS